MPRLPIDYKKSIIYKIVNADESLIYVGSTTDFTMRKSQHKIICNNEKYKQSSLYVYQMIRDNGGWDSFTMIPIQEFPCENKIQLVIEEERNRKELKANLNKYKAYATEDEKIDKWKEYQNAHKEQSKAYRDAHKEQANAYGKAYRDANKDKYEEELTACKKAYNKKYYQKQKK